MELATLIALIAGAVTTIGGYIGGRRLASGQAVSVAQQTVEMFKAQLDLVLAREREKDAAMSTLVVRIEVLETMVLQRVDLEQIKTDLAYIREHMNA